MLNTNSDISAEIARAYIKSIDQFIEAEMSRLGLNMDDLKDYKIEVQIVDKALEEDKYTMQCNYRLVKNAAS